MLEKNKEELPIKKISLDLHNPRGESEAQILSDPEFAKLVASIKLHGILQPIIVKRKDSSVDEFVLIEGERRWRATQKNGLTGIPALIAKNDADGRILAYQVHMLRKPWQKPAETKSIKRIVEDIRKENPSITDTQIKRKLVEITFHKDYEIEDLFALSKYDDSIIDKAASGDLDHSYLVQIEKSFLRPLIKNFPETYKKYGENNIRQILAQKAIDGRLSGTRFFMDKYKHVFKGKQKDKAREVIDSFIGDKDKDIQQSFDEYLKCDRDLQEKFERKTAKKAVKSKVPSKVKPIHVTPKQHARIEDVRKRYESIGKNLSKEENDYIAEALKCLEGDCLRAAVVMIWAAGISRLIAFIATDLGKFNAVSKQMKQLGKPPYKHLSNYKVDTTQEEDLRDGKDVQLLLFLLHENNITRAEYNELIGDYRRRCDSAHPTAIILKPAKVIGMFEDIYDSIFHNTKVK